MHAKQLRAASVQPVICFNKHASPCRSLSVAALVPWVLVFLDGDVPGFRALGWGFVIKQFTIGNPFIF